MIRLFNQYFPPKTLAMMGVEAIWITMALLCAARLRLWSSPEEFDVYMMTTDFASTAVMFVGIFLICFYISDLYNLTTLRPPGEELVSMGQALGAASIILGAIYYVSPPLVIGRGFLLTSIVLVAAFLAAGRIGFHAAWQFAAPRQNVAILGTGSLAVKVAREIAVRGDLNLSLAGFVDAGEGSHRAALMSGAPVLGSVKSLEALVGEWSISRIVVALDDGDSLPADDLVRVRVSGVPVEHAQSTLASLTGRVWLECLQPSWLVFSDGFRRSRSTMVLKRALDLVMSGVGLVVAAPLMALAAIAIKLDSPGRILFRQERVGLRGRTFEVLKLRSMREGAEKPGEARFATKNDPRTTRIGGFLRKFRLDEVPQLVNVLRGDMSFVGPRPERLVFVNEFRKIIPFYEERHSIRPGLTGWAQVQYAYGAGAEDARWKLEYDLYYVKNMSILLDILIVLKTVRTVLTGKGAR
jgi:sugar transferase (PEP-CTERM system associated)